MELSNLLNENLLAFPVLLFALSIHECSHAYTAYLAGDDTAASQGRITLNPLSHIDPIGTVAIPILQFVFSGIPLIGWARPVPVNPLRYKSAEWDLFVPLAGPGSNFALVVISTILLKIAIVTGLIVKPGPLLTILQFFIAINLALGIFNLIPIPPLDGSRVVYKFLASARSPLADKYAALEPYGIFILMLIIISPAGDAFGWIMRKGLAFVYRFII